MVKAVLFDIDGVLLDSVEANLKYFQDLMAAAGYKPPTREEHAKFIHLGTWDAIKALTKLTADDDIRAIWELSNKIPYDNDLLRMPEHAKEVVETLGRKYVLALVSSRSREGVDDFLGYSKLGRHFEASVTYEDTVEHKPHPEPLVLAAARLGVKPEESVYIGDTEFDVRAAKAAGMSAIIYAEEPVGEADYCTSDFDELPNLVEQLQPLDDLSRASGQKHKKHHGR